jgi:hypothetical protein
MHAKTIPILITASLALACATTAPKTQIASPQRLGERILIAPLNVGLRLPTELDDHAELVWNELLRYVETRGAKAVTVSAQDAQQLWEEVMLEGEASGAPPAFHEATVRFARRLAQHADYDRLLLPSLVLRSARINGRRAYWDGVRRPLPLRDPAPAGMIPELSSDPITARAFGLRGRVAAASLHVRILGSDGALVYDGIAGLDVIQEAGLRDRRGGPTSAWGLAAREHPFAVHEHLRQGIELAFEHAVPKRNAAW